MNVGMLWFDNDPKTDLIAKIEKAAEYYQKKYNVTPTVVYVPKAEGTPEQAGGLKVVQNKSVLRGHLWLGHESGAANV